MRKTKIIATIGPASRDPHVLDQLFKAGMDSARLNFSHGTLEEHAEVIKTLREKSEAHQRPIAILQDLGGAKLRLGQIDGSVRLCLGDSVVLVPQVGPSDRQSLPFPHPDVLQRLETGSLVYISDGTVCLEVTEVVGPSVKTRVTTGGIVSSFKGVNIPDVELHQPVLTDAGKAAIRFGIEHKVDWLAISFVRTAQDIREVKSYLEECGGSIPVMAKLETAEALENLDAILREADAVMVARGDLGIEIPMAKVPVAQKDIVRRANEAGRLSVIATQMLVSMIVAPVPTRAEISDISNAVLDGCDAVLLSDETAIGQYPVETLKFADITIQESEKIYPYHKSLPSYDRTQAIASSAASLMRALGSHLVVLTSTGKAAFEVSRYRPDHNTVVISHDDAILRRVCIGWGLIPIGVIPPERDIPKLVARIVTTAIDSGLVTRHDILTIVHGFLTGVTGTTNTIQVLDLNEYITP